MRPGARLPRLLSILALSGLLVPLAPELVWGLAFGLTLLAGACAFEAMLLRRLMITAEAPSALAIPLDEEETLRLALRTNSARALDLEIRQRWPSLLRPGSSQRGGRCHPGEILPIEFTVLGASRGEASLEPTFISATRWGLVERIVSTGSGATVRVMPNLKAVRRLHRQLNRYALRGFGGRPGARLGKGREFDRLRDYVLGDEFRDIAWKASARHNKLIVREFRLDRSQDILVCLDKGHRMAARAANVTRLDHAVNAAVLLAYICNRMEDRVGLLTFAADVESGIAPGRGSAHLRRLTACVTSVEPEYAHTDYRALAAGVRRAARHRTLILIMTALPELEDEDSIVHAVGMLAPQHLPLVVVFSDPTLAAAAQLRPATRQELSRTLVARDIVSARDQVVKELRRRGALVVEASPGDVGLESVNAYIEVKRRQLL